MSQFNQIASAIKTVFDAEFAADGFVLVFDNLHPSLGRRAKHAGISPTEESPQAKDKLVQETELEIKFYNRYPNEIDPTSSVDPTVITTYAERCRAAIGRLQKDTVGTAEVWYFETGRTTYPSDPTGNKTRFHMIVRAYGNNSNLIETVA